MPELQRTFFSADTPSARSRTFGQRTSSAPIPVWMLRSGPYTHAARPAGSHPATSPRHDARLLGMMRDSSA
jgi:hypothetical protein